MAFALVYMGEHYVVDCLAGWLYAAGAFVVVNGIFERRGRVVAVEGAAYAD
jgi:membrane-associated phospholipid phosphatase